MFRRIALALIAAAALGAIAAAPSSASAATSRGSHSAVRAGGLNFGWGYGRGWCYWHPYACYRY